MRYSRIFKTHPTLTFQLQQRPVVTLENILDGADGEVKDYSSFHYFIFILYYFNQGDLIEVCNQIQMAA